MSNDYILNDNGGMRCFEQVANVIGEERAKIELKEGCFGIRCGEGFVLMGSDSEVVCTI